METINSTHFYDSELEMSDEENSMVDVGNLGLNEIRSANEVKKTIKYFLHKFNSQYSGTGPLPVSFLGPLNEALRYSLFDPTLPRPLVLYLHHSKSIAVNIFFQYVLCTEKITDYLSEEFLIWTWDRTREIDYSALLSMLHKYTTREVANTIASYPTDAYPLLVCLSVHQGEIDVVSIIQSTMSEAETITELISSRKKFDRRAELSHSKVVHKNLASNQNDLIPTQLLEPLTQHSSAIDKIKKDFKKYHMQIIRIDHVKNAIWLPQYLEQKKIIDTRLGHNKNEHLLFHGCSRSAAEEIIQHGFDPKLIGMHGTSYGYGFYFASDHRISDFYAMSDLLNNDERTMLVCRVLVGRTCLGDTTMRQCPNGYDSTTDGSKIYVVYSNEQILPEYVITYKEKYGTLEDIPIVYSNKASNSGSCTLF